MSKHDTLTAAVIDRSDWTLADWRAEGDALVAKARMQGAPGMAPHHDAGVAQAYALIAAPRRVTKGVTSKSGDIA